MPTLYPYLLSSREVYVLRLIAVLTAMLTIVTLLWAPNGKSATNSTNEHSLASIIKWEKAQIKTQQTIVKDKEVWRTLTKYTAALENLDAKAVIAHKTYLRKLQVRLAANIKEYKRISVPGVSPRLGSWICIHGYEGAWNANTGNGYYGGLQMDYGFMSTYGLELLNSKGTADHWTPAEQIMVADKAFPSRGYYPWPTTARKCGLL